MLMIRGTSTELQQGVGKEYKIGCWGWGFGWVGCSGLFV